MSIQLTDLNMLRPTNSPRVSFIKSIYQSITLLINTRPGQFPFLPEFGIDLEDELFEFVDELTALDILNRITDKVDQFLPIVSIDFAKSKVIPKPSDNSYDITMIFRIPQLSSEEFSFSGNLSN